MFICTCIDNIASVLNIDIGIQESSFQSACEVPISHNNVESILSSIQNMHQILGGIRTSYPPININISNNICKTQGGKDKMLRQENHSRPLKFLLSYCRDGLLCVTPVIKMVRTKWKYPMGDCTIK